MRLSGARLWEVVVCEGERGDSYVIYYIVSDILSYVVSNVVSYLVSHVISHVISYLVIFATSLLLLFKLFALASRNE